MEENTQLPKEVVERILKARDALVVGDRDEAYHQLYGIASPKFDKYYPWGEMEKQVGHIRLNEQDIINSKEVTAYASKLHQANETIKVLEYDNNKLKGEVDGLTNAVEELRTKYDNILATESGHESKTENVWQSGYAAGHEAGCERGKREAQPGAVWVKAKPANNGFYAVKYAGGGYGGCGFKDGKWNQSLADNKIDAYLDESAAGREEDKALFDNWHRWLSDNGYTYDGEYYYDEDNNYFTPDQLWVKFK